MTRTITTMLLGLFLMSSCQDVPAPKIEESKTMNVPVVEQEYTDRVMTNDVGRAIAALAASGEYGLHNSRAMLYSVDSLKAKDGSLTAFVVNFANDGGFILLSPTKKYYPVLAYSDKGRFDVNVSGSPVEVWAEDMSDVIGNVDALPADTLAKYRRLWNSLLFESTIDKIPSTNMTASRAEGEVSDEEMQRLYRIVRDKREEFESLGYKTYFLYEYFGDYDPDTYANVAQMAQASIYPLYDHVWDELTFVVDIYNVSTTTTDNMLNTVWGQDGMFNANFPYISETRRAYAGCGPVAVGQIMYYHKYPVDKLWSSMVTSYGNITTSNFLYELAERANADYKIDGTETTIINLRNALRTYGYMCDKADFSLAKVRDEIVNNRPVALFAEGKIKKENSDVKRSAHAWVASGISTSKWEYNYVCYTMTQMNGMASFYQTPKQYIIQKSLYMNWGWNGRYDGFYAENGNLTIPGYVAPAENRTMMCIQKPE